MNKFIKFAVPAIALLSLTACSTSTPDTQQPNNQTQNFQQAPQNVPVQPPAPSKEDVFYSYISANFPGVARQDALNLGNSICLALSQGTTLLQIGQVGVNAGFTPAQAGQIVGASIGSLCPEYKYLVDQLS